MAEGVAKRIFVLGSMNCDLVINTPRMPVGGETITGSGFFLNSGGKGANQAVACAKLGAQTCLIGGVGRDTFGASLVKSLSGYGVDISYVKEYDSSSGVAVIIVENGENRIILDGGANRLVTKSHIDAALDAARAGDIFITQLENNMDAVEYGIEQARRRNLTVIFNPAPAVPVKCETLAAVDYLILNETECALITGVLPETEKDVERAYAALGVPIKGFIVTMGSRGSICRCDGRTVVTAAEKVKVADTTAAGDTFVGAFACGLSRGETVESCIKFATHCSALTCTGKGAQQSIPTLEQALK